MFMKSFSYLLVLKVSKRLAHKHENKISHNSSKIAMKFKKHHVDTSFSGLIMIFPFLSRWFSNPWHPRYEVNQSFDIWPGSKSFDT